MEQRYDTVLVQAAVLSRLVMKYPSHPLQDLFLQVVYT